MSALNSSPAASRGLIPLLILGLTGTSGGTVGPIVLNLLVARLALPERLGAFVLAAEAAGYAVGNLLFAGRIHRMRWRTASWWSLAFVIFANCGSTLTHNYVALLGLRFVSGIGMGVVGAVMNATAGSRSDSQRVFALITMVFLIYSCGLLASASFIAAVSGLGGLYGLIAALAGIGAVAVRWMPESSGSPKLSSPIVVSERRVRTGRSGGFLVLGMLALYAGHNVLWAFQGRMGLALGLDGAWIGYLLSISAIGGIVGAFLALRLKLTWGFLKPQVAVLIGLTGAALLLIYPSTVFIYVTAAFAIKIAWFFGLPYMQGALATLDRSGRLIAVGSAAQTIGASVGPATGGLISVGGLRFVGYAGLIYYVSWAALVFPVLWALDGRKSTLTRPVQ